MELKLNLSLCMIVKNEADKIKGFLKLAMPHVNEVIIVDTGSTDGTVEIAKERGANVFEQKWEDDFSKARNFGIRKALGKWVLVLDADEIISSKDWEKIEKITESDTNSAAIVTISTHYREGNKTVRFPSIRLWKNNPRIRYVGKIHEQQYPSIKALNYSLLSTEITVVHSGYNVSSWQLRIKAQRNLDILLGWDVKYPLKDYTIAQCYGILGNFKKSAQHLEMVLKQSDKIPEDVKIEAEASLRELKKML